MLTFIIRVVLLLFSCTSQAYIKPHIPIEHWQTAEKIPVYFVSVKELPIVDISIAFDAGSARDGKQWGLAALTHKVFLHKKINAIKTFEDLSAEFSGTINRDIAIFHLRATNRAPEFDQALQLVKDIFASPPLSHKAVEYAKQQLKNKSQKRLDNIKSKGKESLFAALYGHHPYGHSPNSDAGSLDKLSLDDVKSFYAKHYVIPLATISIVGNINNAQAKAIAAEISKHIPQGAALPPIPKATLAQPGNPLVKIPHPSTQAHLLIGTIGINPTNQDFFPLMVGNQILGGGALISRLGNEIRLKRGLTYSISSQFYLLAANGPFFIKFQTHHSQAKEALALTQKVISDFVKEGPTTAELKAAKQKLIGNFPIHFDSNQEIINQLIKIGFYHLPLDYFSSYQDQINAVTTQQVKKAFQQHLNPNNLTTIIVGGEKPL